MKLKKLAGRLLPRQTTFTAVDFGTHSIRIATVSCAGTEPELLQLSRVALPMPQEGEPQEAARVKALAEAVDANGLSGRPVFAVLSSDKVIIRHVRIPYMPEKELVAAVNSEAEKSIPIPLSDLVVRYVKLGETAEGEVRQINLLLAAVPLDEVHSFYELFARAGLTISALDLQPLALWRALAGASLDGQAKEVIAEVTAIVDIGAVNTTLIVARGDLLLFCRSLPVGGDLLTRSMADSYGISFEEARQMKEEHGKILSSEEAANVFAPDEMQLDLSLRDGLGELVREIRRSLDYYRGQEGSLPVEKILLSGGTANLKGFVPFMEDALELPTETGTVSLKVPADLGDELPYQDPSFFISVGLALREAGLFADKYKINLLPKELQKDTSIDMGRLKKTLTIGIVALLIFGGYGTFLWQYQARNGELRQVQSQLAALQPMADEADLIKEEQLAISKRSGELEGMLMAQPRWSRILGDINGNIPVDTLLTSIHVTNTDTVPVYGGFSSPPGYSIGTRPPQEAVTQEEESQVESKQEQDSQEPVSLPLPNLIILEGISQTAASVGVLVNNMHNMPYFKMVKLRSIAEDSEFEGHKYFIIDCYLEEVGDGVEQT